MKRLVALRDDPRRNYSWARERGRAALRLNIARREWHSLGLYEGGYWTNAPLGPGRRAAAILASIQSAAEALVYAERDYEAAVAGTGKYAEAAARARRKARR